MLNSKNIVAIPEGAIFLNGSIYILMDTEKYKEIPINSILYNNKIYVPFNDDIGSNDIKNDHLKDIEKKPFKNSNNNSDREENIINDNNIQITKKKSKKNLNLSIKQKNTNIKNENLNDNYEELYFIKLSKYYYNIESNKIMKYSANKFNKSRKNNKIISITYNCYNTYCSARGNAIVKYSKIKDKDKLVIEHFIIKVNHSLPYEEHVYIINKKIEKDLKNNKINKDMLEKITYSRSYFINYIKLNPYLQITKIENDFIKTYNIKEISSRQNSNIKIPVKKVINSAHLHMKRINDLNNFSINNIRKLIDYEGNQIVESITSEYLKNNIIIKDDIYILLTNNMKKNLNEVKADNIFIDCTYKIISPGLKNYKFLVVIGYYDNNNKLVLYLFALIRHENIQNFESIFNYLKIKFNFRPEP